MPNAKSFGYETAAGFHVFGSSKVIQSARVCVQRGKQGAQISLKLRAKKSTQLKQRKNKPISDYFLFPPYFSPFFLLPAGTLVLSLWHGSR